MPLLVGLSAVAAEAPRLGESLQWVVAGEADGLASTGLAVGSKEEGVMGERWLDEQPAQVRQAGTCP
jgi:hypothetical protein